MKKIPVVTAYEIDGLITGSFPSGSRLDRAKPVTEYLDGWMCDISGCRKYSDLPRNAQKYVEFIAGAVGCRIRYVSVGAERDAYIEME